VFDKLRMALNLSTDGSLFRTIFALLRSAGSNNIARWTAHRSFIEPWFDSSTSSSEFTLIVRSAHALTLPCDNAGLPI
jgi:hypothetical protein